MQWSELATAFFYYIVQYTGGHYRDATVEVGYDEYPSLDFYENWYDMESPTVYRDCNYVMVF